MEQQDLIQQQRKLWNTFSPGWRKWDSFVMKWLQPIGEKLIEVAKLRDDDLILDVATGTGEPGLTVATKVGRGKVIGTDVAEGMISLAQENAKRRGIANYQAQVSDASHLPLQTQEFSVILCRFGVMYFANPQADVKEIVRMLKQGGRIAFSAWTQPEKNPWATTSGKTVQEILQLPPPPPDTPGIFRYAQAGALAQLFQGAGLKDIQETKVRGKLEFDSAEQYWEYTMDVVAPVAVALSEVDVATRKKVKQAILLRARSFEKGGKIIFPWSSWVVSGKK